MKGAPKKLKEKDCFTNGKYCFIAPKNDLSLEKQFHASPEIPRKILEETIRERCLFNILNGDYVLPGDSAFKADKDHLKWFSYMTNYNSFCLNFKETDGKHYL